MMRFEGVDYDSNQRAMGTSFHAQSANKLSVAVDIKTADGQEIIRKLSKESDVLVENYRCGSLENLGLGYKSLKTQNPGFQTSFNQICLLQHTYQLHCIKNDELYKYSR